MITFPRGLDDSSSESTSTTFITSFGGLIEPCDSIKLLGGGLENFLSTADITLLAALVPISDPTLLTPASNALCLMF